MAQNWELSSGKRLDILMAEHLHSVVVMAAGSENHWELHSDLRNV